jgi:hypothetical protein
MIPELKYARLGSTRDAGGVHARLRFGMALLLNLESIPMLSEASESIRKRGSAKSPSRQL